MKDQQQLLYRIALTMIPGVGSVLAKNLISYCGSEEAVFRQKKKLLEKIPEVGPKTAAVISRHDPFSMAEKEVEFILKHKIKTYFYLDKDFPQRLKHCHDSPILLYFKGEANLNKPRMISLVGTRTPTEYGKMVSDILVDQLAAFEVTIVSGLAYGIDIHAHRAALRNNMPTIGVVAHGLDRLYPGSHRSTAVRMIEDGGIITEYPSGTNPDRENFPSRNRIVAGMCDAVVVIEAPAKSGALITADIAQSYDRDVFAIPGRIDDPFSIGCNKFIMQNRAALITSADDIAYLMGWDNEAEGSTKNIKGTQQQQLFFELNTEETVIMELLKEHEKLDIDLIMLKAKIPFSKLSGVLLGLEMKGAIRSLPGKVYQRI
ncbi:DNA-processing protein DprA [soil metagenome]